MSTVQCPVCALRFRFQSELEQHARGDHCPPPEVHLPRHRRAQETPPARTGRVLRLP